MRILQKLQKAFVTFNLILSYFQPNMRNIALKHLFFSLSPTIQQVLHKLLYVALEAETERREK